MNDAIYTFKTDVRERRGEANGAHGKRSHCGKGGMSMPSVDYKSKKEIDKLNGPVLSYNVHKPLGWETYKSMPETVRVEYTKSLIDNFGISMKHLSEMLGKPISSMYTVSKDLGIKSLFHRGGAHDSFDKAKWDAFILGHYVIPSAITTPATLPNISKKQLTKSIFSKPGQPEEFVQEEAAPDDACTDVVEKVCDDIANKATEVIDAVKTQMRITKCNISFDGTPDFNAIMNTLRLITGGWNSSQIDISVVNV